MRRPSTLIAVDFGEMENFSPWCVSRRHTKESGQRGKPVTLREALQAVEAVVINQSDTLNGFAFSEEGHLVQIDDRPLLDKNGDYRMFAARFEQKDGTTELHLPTSEVLKRKTGVNKRSFNMSKSHPSERHIPSSVVFGCKITKNN